ncbi:MAG TPA: radical SAM family heme chaperone HemW [Desulfobacterales bacterium]|nr:radical SAM family heme chaperone HemW [Desulfobacterales bacterium]
MSGLYGLYIHIPFCRRKCLYCSFVSQACGGRPPAAYLEALLSHIRQYSRLEWLREREISSIFIGGGTPSLYDGKSLARLISAGRDSFNCQPGLEISMESNPNSLSPAQLDLCREAGLNRLSIGVQSFNDRLLKVLGRSHSRNEARQAFGMARAAGFDNINLDLMYGLPGQSLTDWRQTLEQAAALAPEHLSIYELSVEPDTPFAELRENRRLTLLAEEEVIEQENLTYSLLERQGLERYEISNFARPGRQCRHNLNYWRNGSYLGIGAAAVSCLSGLRLRNVDKAETYIKMVRRGLAPLAEGEALSREAAFRESVIMGLRMLRGVSLIDLRLHYDLHPLDYYGPALRSLVERGLIVMDDTYMRLSLRALPVANQILAELV